MMSSRASSGHWLTAAGALALLSIAQPLQAQTEGDVVNDDDGDTNADGDGDRDADRDGTSDTDLDPYPFSTSTSASATRVDVDLSATPAAVTVLPRSVIESTLSRRTDDALLLVPSVQLGNGYGGTWDDYNVRGFRVWAGTTFRNGFLNSYSAPNVADTANVDRIEVLRGPASVAFGPTPPGGAINFVTSSADGEARRIVRVIGAYPYAARTELDFGGPLSEEDGLDVRVIGAAELDDGYRDHETTGRWLANPTLRWQPSRRTRVTLELEGHGNYFRSDGRGVPIVNGDPFALSRRRSFTEPDLPLGEMLGGLSRIEAQHRIGRHLTLRGSVQAKLGSYDELAVNSLGLRDDGRTLNRLVYRWELRAREIAARASLVASFETEGVEHEIVAGIDGSHEWIDWRMQVADPGAMPYPIDIYTPQYGQPLPMVPTGGPKNHWRYSLAGAYVSERATVTDGLSFLLSGRVDLYEQVSELPDRTSRRGNPGGSARAGVIYEPVPTLAFWASAGQGFWPVLGVAADGGVLSPEHGLTFESGVRFLPEQRELTFDLTGYWLRNYNISVPDPANPDFQVQRGEATSFGLEVSATARLTDRARLIAAYAWVDAQVTDDPISENIGHVLPLTAAHTGSLWLEGSPLKCVPGLLLRVGGAFSTDRVLLDRAEIPGYGRLDAGIGYRAKAWRTTLRVENVLNTKYVRSGTDAAAIVFGRPLTATLEVALDL